MKKTILLPALLLLLAALLITLGVRRGEVETVYEKSTNICLECVGIG
ncbi:MAG: hypothetical protein IJU41_04355 [Clostridia bacterium]|nr:hypothetical protein [Clostridia bacterium]